MNTAEQASMNKGGYRFAPQLLTRSYLKRRRRKRIGVRKRRGGEGIMISLLNILRRTWSRKMRTNRKYRRKLKILLRKMREKTKWNYKENGNITEKW
jgi:hypothetical protein